MYRCTNCDSNVKGKIKTPGSFLIELILWFFFIIPGLIYSIWRFAGQKRVCEVCGYPYLVKIKN